MNSNAMALLRVTFLFSIGLPGLARGEDYFSEQPIWSSGTDISGGDGIARFIDFDRDGDLDFVTSAPEPMRWVLYRNEGGKLSRTPFWESAPTSDLDHIDVVDFNQDGWPDLAATHETHCTLYFNKRGSFDTLPDWETGIIANANQISFGDYDGDGDLDMVMAAGSPIDGVAIFENTTGTPAQKPTLKLGHAEYSEAAIFADYDNDGDGKLDVIAHYPSGKTIVYRNVSHKTDNQFDDGTVVFEDAANPWTQRHYLHDLDGDGEAELFSAKGPWGNNGTSLQLVKVPGAETLQVRWRSSSETMIHAFEFQDVDGDGDADLLAADYANGGQVYVYLNEDGQLAKVPVQSVAATGPVHEVVLGDIDLDGDLDLAVGGRDQAHIYENLTITTGYRAAAKQDGALKDE